MSEQEHDNASTNPYQPPNSELRSLPPSQISLPLASLLLAVVVAAFFFNVQLGIGFVLATVPAYVRSVKLSRRRHASGLSLTTQDRVLGFVGSVGIVFVCALAGCVAFFVTCTGGFLTNAVDTGTADSFTYFMFLCGAVCLVAAGFVYWLCWPSGMTRQGVSPSAQESGESE